MASSGASTEAYSMEHLCVKGRITWYETVDRKRPHRGRGMEGRTPYQVFKAGVKLAKKAARTPSKEGAVPA